MVVVVVPLPLAKLPPPLTNGRIVIVLPPPPLLLLLLGCTVGGFLLVGRRPTTPTPPPLVRVRPPPAPVFTTEGAGGALAVVCSIWWCWPALITFTLVVPVATAVAELPGVAADAALSALMLYVTGVIVGPSVSVEEAVVAADSVSTVAVAVAVVAGALYCSNSSSDSDRRI